MGHLNDIAVQGAQVDLGHQPVASCQCQIAQKHHVGPVERHHVGHAAVIYEITAGLVGRIEHLDPGRTRLDDLAGNDVSV